VVLSLKQAELDRHRKLKKKIQYQTTCQRDANLQAISKKDSGTESRHIRVVNRRHTGGCRGFSRRINEEFRTKDFFEVACRYYSTRFAPPLPIPKNHQHQ
jgi:hypothetical protein